MVAAVTVSVGTLLPLFEQASRGGVSRSQLLAGVGLFENRLTDDAQIPYDLATRLWETAAALTSDGAFGVHAGERVPNGLFDIAEYLALSCQTVEEGMGRLCHYQRLITDVATFAFEGRTLRLQYRLTGNRLPPSRHASEYLLAVIVQKLRDATGVHIAPARVKFRHAAAKKIIEHERFFASNISFSQRYEELVFSAPTLAMRLQRSDKKLNAILERQAAALLARLPTPDHLSGKLSRWLLEHLSDLPLTLEGAARAFGQSERSLQRQLEREGNSFEYLLEQSRRAEALRLLVDPKMALSEVAYAVGFSEPSAFHRAFKRWTGATPAAYRDAKDFR